MDRTGFGLGVVVGGLAGLAAGYLIRERTNGESSEDALAPDTIDLTPALERRSAAAAPVEVAEAIE